MFALVLLGGRFPYAMGSALEQITKLTAEAPGHIREIEEWLESNLNRGNRFVVAEFFQRG